MSEEAEFDERELVKLTSVSDELQAQLLETLLADQSIRCFIRTWHSHAYDGIFELQRGYAEVRVFKDDLAGAKEVLGDFQRALEEELPGEPDGEAPESN